MTKSGFVATEFVANSVAKKSSFVAIEFVVNSVAIKSGFSAKKICHWLCRDKILFCHNKALSLALSQQNPVLSRQSLLLTLLQQNLVFSQESFVAGFVMIKSGFVTTKLCHWLCWNKIC